MSLKKTRKIIHIDMDAFYASIEQRDSPELKNRPLIVGGSPNSRSVVCSASYEARRFGVRSAMSCAQAFRLCPQAIFISPHFEKYSQASLKMREIFKKVTSLIEPLGLDEAYLDVTENLLNEPMAKKIAVWIKDQIMKEIGTTASAGVGPNKFIAKLASDSVKPNGLVVVPPEKVFAFIQQLPVEKFWGVGPATTKKLHSKEIRTAADIRRLSPHQLQTIVGSYSSSLFEMAHGRDEREVDPSLDRKSKGSETTFKQDILNRNELLRYLEMQCLEISVDLKKLEMFGKTITLKIKYFDFKSITRSKTLFQPTNEVDYIYETAQELLSKDTEVGHRPVRLIGVSIGNLIYIKDPMQLWFEFPRIEFNLTKRNESTYL